jgi:guanine deaminase
MARPVEILPARTAHRGRVLSFRSDPGTAAGASAFDYFDDGLLVLADGHVVAAGPASQLLPSLEAGVRILDHAQRLLLPGFIDTHIHYPQTDVIAAPGEHLLDWLEHYTFPAEARFADTAYARTVAEFFCDELLRNGTTSAQVLGTVHAAATDAFFEVAQARQLRMIAGKVLMDRHCPPELQDSAEQGERESRALIERWHGRERLHYAITPRFAATSSAEQLAGAGRLAAEYPDVFIHSHLAENTAEVAWIRELFPQSRSYLDVYEGFGLLRERATYAHCIHLDSRDRQRMAAAGACVAFAPTSNLYLGSGLFDLAAADAAGLRFALATDVGGGSSFSMLRTLGEAYKVAQLQSQRLTPLRAFYLATLGAARSLHLEDRIGRFGAGTEADFVVLDPAATPLIARRMGQCQGLAEQLLVWMTLGDDRAIAATYVLGQPAWVRE